MLKDLIAKTFCSEIGRKLRRLGVLGLISSSLLAIYVELPLEISIATRETQAAMVGIQHSIEHMLTQARHHTLYLNRLHVQQAKRDH
jgi:hypothetical protein